MQKSRQYKMDKQLTKEQQEKIMQIQSSEQNLQHLLAQKQQIQSQSIEIEGAQEELKKSKNKVFKIVGSVMVESTKEQLEKDLSEKKEMIDLKIKNIDKQEEKIRKSSKTLQEEILKAMKNEQ